MQAGLTKSPLFDTLIYFLKPQKDFALKFIGCGMKIGLILALLVIVVVTGCTQNVQIETKQPEVKITNIKLVETDENVMSINFFGKIGHFTEGKYWALLVTISNTNNTSYPDLNIHSEGDAFVSRRWFSDEFDGTGVGSFYIGY